MPNLLTVEIRDVMRNNETANNKTKYLVGRALPSLKHLID